MVHNPRNIDYEQELQLDSGEDQSADMRDPSDGAKSPPTEIDKDGNHINLPFYEGTAKSTGFSHCEILPDGTTSLLPLSRFM